MCLLPHYYSYSSCNYFGLFPGRTTYAYVCLIVCFLELLGDLLKDKPVEETGYDNIIVVDNAPKVGPDRMTKLQSVLTKVFGRFGKIVSQDYPIDDNGTFKG